MARWQGCYGKEGGTGLRMQPHKIIFTSDLHGNEIQYKKLVEYAIKNFANGVIIGGDIAPKNLPKEEFISSQRTFLKNKLPMLLGPLKAKLPETRIFLMLGNDDCKINEDVLKETEESHLYQVIHNRRIKLTDNFEIIGYSYVPITPFGIKDWEKYDFSEVPPELKEEYLERKRTNYRLAAKKSFKEGWRNFAFTPETERQDSIQKDLMKEKFTANPKQTIYVFHSPPNKTNLDQVAKGVHVGSFSERIFIEEQQPFLTLHGHIHETVDVSGSFKDQIGKTLAMSSGNHNVGEKLAILVFDLDNLKEARREII